jgi:hypothetical protein
MSPLFLLFAGVLASSGPDFARIVAGRSRTNRCMLLPQRLQSAPALEVDLNADGRRDLLLEMPGRCVVSACTWRAYVGCSEGGYRLLLERIALSMEPTAPAVDGWLPLRVAVPAPSSEPQAWLYHHDGGFYVPVEAL